MIIMRMIVTPKNVTIVTEWGTLQKLVEPKKGEKCLRVDVEDKASLWHLHFDHLHHDGLKELEKKNMVHGL